MAFSEASPLLDRGDRVPGLPPPQPAPEPPAKPPVRELGSLEPHDARSRYEPAEGPTALAGSWLKHEAQAAAPEAEEDDPSRAALQDGSPRAIDVLKSSRIVTEVESSAPSSGRPALVTVACVVLGLLGVAFFLHLVTAGPLGAATAAIGIVLGILGIVRLWTGHWDGMVPGVLFCLGVAGGAWFPSKLPEARLALLAGAGVALVLLTLILLLPSGRRHLLRS